MPLRLARPADGLGLVDVARDGVLRGIDRVDDRVGADLPAADGIDLPGGAAERRIHSCSQVPDRRPEELDLARPRHDPAGPAQDDRQPCRQRDERRDRKQVDDVVHGWRGRPPQPDRARRRSSSAVPTSNRSPTTNRSANSAIGASGITVDGHDRPRRPHPDLVLDRATDPEREVELGLDDLAGLPDLLAVRDPAGIDRRAGRPDGATELLRDLLDDPEAVRRHRRRGRRPR